MKKNKWGIVLPNNDNVIDLSDTNIMLGCECGNCTFELEVHREKTKEKMLCFCAVCGKQGVEVELMQPVIDSTFRKPGNDTL